MSLPASVKQQVETQLQAFCEKRIPPDIRHQLNMTFEFRGNSVTLIENRPYWKDPSQWTHLAIAKFRYYPSNGQWTLYWADRNSRWHLYPEVEPTPHFEILLQEVDRDPSGIFFG
jgi:hypothetical protein